MANDWKTVRVVVEVRVRGDYTEKDMRYDVEQSVDWAHLPRLRMVPPRQRTRPVVKSHVRATAATNRKTHPNHDQFSELRRLLDELRTRVSRLETDTNPHALDELNSEDDFQ